MNYYSRDEVDFEKIYVYVSALSSELPSLNSRISYSNKNSGIKFVESLYLKISGLLISLGVS